MAIFTGKGEDEKNEHFIHPLTELGNAELFVQLYREVAFFIVGLKLWLIWEGGRWTTEPSALMKMVKQVIDVRFEDAHREEDLVTIKDEQVKHEDALKWAKKSSSKRSIKAMLDLAKDLPGMAIKQDVLDKNPYILGVKNGVLDIRTGALRLGDPGDLVTNYANASYDAKATCPRWRRFISEVALGRKELVDFLQEFVGYVISGLISEQAFFILLGAGGNGKSTFVELIARLLGSYAVGMPGYAFIASNSRGARSEFARLAGKRLASGAETGTCSKLDESNIKRLTGSDTMTARFRYRDEFDYTPMVKILFSANTVPVITGADNGIYRRLKIIPWEADFRKKDDKKLPQKLAEELDGILTWAVEGFRRFWERGELEYPKCIVDAGVAYRDQMDITGAFLQERCACGEGQIVPVGKLYEAFKTWANEACIEPVGKQQFSALLMQKGYRQKASGGRKWLGICLATKSVAESQIIQSLFTPNSSKGAATSELP